MTRTILHMATLVVALACAVIVVALAMGAVLLEPTVERAVLVGALAVLAAVSLLASIEQVREAGRGERLRPEADSTAGAGRARAVASSSHRNVHAATVLERHVPEDMVVEHREAIDRVELGGEQADVSVLMCSIKGFTSWAEDKAATEIVSELNALLGVLASAVMEGGGTLDKYTGDGLMAFWGAPVAMDDHAGCAVRAALDMKVRLDELNGVRVRDGHQPFAIGVVVHSGSAVVGGVGSEQRLDYTALGATVNAAARLAGASRELEQSVVVSGTTIDLLAQSQRGAAQRVAEVASSDGGAPIQAWVLDPSDGVREVDDEARTDGEVLA